MTAFVTAGIIGGLLRGGLGIAKYSLSYKNVNLKPWYFAGTVLLSGIIGGAAAWVTNDLGIAFLGVDRLSPAIAFLVGYAGGDFLESIAKVLFKKAKLPSS